MDVWRVELQSNRVVYNQTYLAAFWGNVIASTRAEDFPSPGQARVTGSPLSLS